MKTQSTFTLSTIVILFSILIVSCKKDIALNSSYTKGQQQSIMSSELNRDINSKPVISWLTGTYDVVGTRKDYIGNIADSILYNVYDLSTTSPKTITNSHDTLFCSYAIMGDFWQYVITFDAKTKEMNIQPNTEMLNSIVPGSWVVYDNYYNPGKKQFYFKTGLYQYS
jgi:hypothetical protein